MKLCKTSVTKKPKKIECRGNSKSGIIRVYVDFIILKGKFSSGIEGALASTLNRNFNWKQLSEMTLCIFVMFSKFI